MQWDGFQFSVVSIITASLRPSLTRLSLGSSCRQGSPWPRSQRLFQPEHNAHCGPGVPADPSPLFFVLVSVQRRCRLPTLREVPIRHVWKGTHATLEPWQEVVGATGQLASGRNLSNSPAAQRQTALALHGSRPAATGPQGGYLSQAGIA